MTLRIVDAAGNTLQSVTLDRKNANLHTLSVTLNAAASNYVRQTGNLYVVYTQSANGFETVLEVEYQRLRAS